MSYYRPRRVTKSKTFHWPFFIGAYVLLYFVTGNWHDFLVYGGIVLLSNVYFKLTWTRG